MKNVKKYLTAIYLLFVFTLIFLPEQLLSMDAETLYPTISGYLPRAKSISLPLNNNDIKRFTPENHNCGFSFFDNAEIIKNSHNILCFKTHAESAVLGWGNYPKSNQKLADTNLWSFYNQIVLKIRQLGDGQSKWSVKPLVDSTKGKIIGVIKNATPPQTLNAGEWRELSFDISNNVTIDGLEFVVKAPPETEFEIRELIVTRPVYSGYVVKDFDIPPGKIWKAVANVGGISNEQMFFYTSKIITRLYVNGREVPRGLTYMNKYYGAYPVDISPYLKPGQRNRIGIYGWRTGSSSSYSPFMFLQSDIIMNNGEIINVITGPDWKFSAKATANWSSPESDIMNWSSNLPSGTFVQAVHQLVPPVYTGIIKLKNPAKNDLYYSDNRKVILNVSLPPGLSKKSLLLSWQVYISDRMGNLKELSTGKSQEFLSSPGILMKNIDLGHLSSGVYAVSFELRDKTGTLIASRRLEPFVVIAKLNQKIIAGTNYLEGMDLKLEDEIDFTATDGSQPWIETYRCGCNTPAKEVKTPTIVERNGLKYREVTGEERGSFFSYRYEFKHPGDWYIFELEYPDDADRCIELVISTKKEQVWSNSQAGVGAETGGKFFKTGKMKKLYWPHIADSGVHSIDVINVQTGWKAAVKSLKIYHLKGNLPAVETGNKRKFSVFTENSKLFGNAGMNFGMDYPKTPEEQKTFWNLPYLQQLLIKLHDMKKCGERYAEYLRFSGQNANLIGCYQYAEGTAPFFPVPDMDYSSVYPCMAIMLANILDINGISFFTGMEFSTHGNLATFYNNSQVLEGAKTNYLVNARGEQFYGTNGNLLANWTLPEYQKTFCQVVKDLNRTFGGLRNYRGISGLFCLVNLSDGYYPPGLGYLGNYDDYLAYSFDDYTFENFEKDTGLDFRLAPNDPNRFSKRSTLLKSNPEWKQIFVKWRCEKFRDFIQKISKTLRKDRSDLMFINILAAERRELYKNVLKKNIKFDNFLRNFGVDVDLLSKVPNQIFTRWCINWQQLHEEAIMKISSQHPYTWLAKEDYRFIEAFNRFEHRGVLCRTSWDENSVAAPEVKGDWQTPVSLLKGFDWVMKFSRTRALPQPGSFNAREAFLQAIITSDPEIIFGGYLDLNVNVGHEDVLRDIMSVFTRLPKKGFKPVLNTNLTSNLVIRQLNNSNESWIYIANPGYWESSGVLTFSEPEEIIDVSTGEKVKMSNNNKLDFKLEPFALKAFRLKSKKAQVTGYETNVISDQELAFMKKEIINRIKGLLRNDWTKLALAPDDRRYMEEKLTKADIALADKKYALTWSLLKTPRFWTLWKDFLEKGADRIAKVPDNICITKRKDETSLPELKAFKVESKPKLEEIIKTGKIAKNGCWSSPFISIKEGTSFFTETVFSAAYDNNNLYLTFIAGEKDISKLKTDAKNEREVFSDDSIGIMVQPDEDSARYYQLAFNSKGIKFDQEINGGERNYDFNPDWQVETLKKKGYWTALVIIPFKVIKAKTPGEKSWRINCYQISSDKVRPIRIWNRPEDILKGAHDTKRFGYLRFQH